MTEAKEKARRSRGANGNGGATWRASKNLWEWRETLPDGRRFSAYAKEQAEAKAKCEKKVALALQGIDVKASKQTLGEFLSTWLRDHVQPTNAPKTFVSYRDTVNKHILPRLGGVQLEKLTPQQVQALLAEKQREGLSPRTVAYIRTVLRIALNRAVRWSLVTRNVAALVDPPRQERVERQVMTPEQAAVFLQSVQGDRLEALYLVTATLGLRLGEVLGLRWQDLDLEASTLRVEQTVQRVDGRLIYKTPKTRRSRRTLTIPATVVASLRAHRDRQRWETDRAGWVDHGLVFPNTYGGPIEPSNVLARFKKALAKAGLPEQRFHDLRHYAASFLVAQGVPMRVVMDILGHSQMATTADLYAHVMPAAHRDVADLIDRALAANG